MKRNKLKIVLIAFLVATVLSVATLMVYAFFTTQVYVYTDSGKEVMQVGMNLQLLFGKLEGVADDTDLKIPSYTVVDGYVQYNDGVTEGQTTLYDSQAAWGTAQNPYILSEPRHLQNLSALQSVGYFDLLYIANNFDSSGNYIEGNASIPYFLICNSDGTPIALDGSDLEAIEPIGSAEHPFIGVIGGAFVDGETTVNGKNSSVSAIHGFKIQTNTNQTDVGLFGYIGFLGEELTSAEITDRLNNATADNPAELEFEGVFSSIQDVLISDVSVIVDKPGLDEIISELFEPFWTTLFNPNNEEGAILHRFTYSDKSNADELPHETHHIGIFAGHVSYALVDNINVYYSSDDIYAIDVTGTDAADNYYSASGILGMMYNMNCAVENVTDGNCVVKMGTGTSTDEVAGGGEGTGTGGGELSGNGRGYVTASEIFADYNNVDVTQSNNELLWRYKLTESSAWVENAILILKKSDGTYTLADGKTVATINNSVVNQTWNNYLVREVYQSNSGEELFKYTAPNGTSVYTCEIMGNKYNDQVIWKYTAGGDGIWHYGIRVFKTTVGETVTYKLEDGTEVDYENGVIITKDDSTVWKFFFFTVVTVTSDDQKHETNYMVDASTNKEWLISNFERMPMTLIKAFNDNGEMLCVEWERQRIFGGTEATGLYYFYDGVFTFGLSSKDDTIRDTWENNVAPPLYIGANNAEAWEVNPQRGNKALVSLLKPVTNNKELDLAIEEGKQFYITAQPNETDAYLMSLLTSNSNGKPGAIRGQALELGNNLKEELCTSYQGGIFNNLPVAPNTKTGESTMTVEYVEDGVLKSREVTLNDLITQSFWNNYTVLNVGRTSATMPLDQLKVEYNVTAQNAGQDFYFRADTGAYVVPSGNSIPEYYSWDGYVYYTYTTKSTYEKVLGRDFESERLYTYTYFYQPPNNAVPIMLGTSTYNITGTYIIVGYYMPSFNYSMVTYSGISSQIGASITRATGNNNTVQGELMFSITYLDETTNQNVTINSVPMINLTDNRFHGDSNDGQLDPTVSFVSGSVVSKQLTTTLGYYYWDVVKEKYYQADGRTEIADPDTYQTNNPSFVRLNKYPSYFFTDSNKSSYLQILKQFVGEFWGFGYGSDYSIWAGTGDDYGNLNLADDHSMNGVLVFEKDPSTDEVYCYIQYAMDSVNQFVGYSYDATNKSATFSGSSSKVRLYVYIIEGVIDMDFGVNTFVPKDLGAENSTSYEYSADQMVLWPQTTLTQSGYNTNTGYGSTINAVASTTQNATKFKTDDPIYTLVPLTGNGGLNWGTKNGFKLGDYGLDKKFQMADQATFGTLINIGDWSIPIGETNTMVAPVGSNGVKATIPKGCVAFRVESGGTQTIRIIVAVPTTDKYFGEGTFDLDLDLDYYIGVWKVEAAGESLTSSFNKSAAVEKFELPRSYTYSFNDDPSSVETNKTYTIIEYDANGDGTKEQYRTYLNGDCFLVAYEFTIGGENEEGGVYVIGSVHGDSNTSSSMDVPMEIVHFSVSGTASAGRDGVTGNQLGAIDFVYDDMSNTIVTIDKSGASTGIGNGAGEYYSNYYASHCLLYSNNDQKDANSQFVIINQGKVWVRRYLADQTNGNYQTTISYKVTSSVSDAFMVNQYAPNSDTIVVRP